MVEPVAQRAGQAEYHRGRWQSGPTKSAIGDALKETDSADRLKLKSGIALWQKDLKEYGANQGFTIQ